MEPLTLKIERTLDAPIEKVWEAWSNPEVMKKWLAPESFDIVELEGEFKVGGEWKETMKSDQFNFHGSVRGIYKVIEPPHKIVSSHIWTQPNTADEFESEYTLELQGVGGKTQMTFTQVGFHNEESCGSHEEGWKSTFNRLSALLQ